MKNSSARSNSRIIYLSVGSMILGVLFIDIYGIIIKFLGDTYSTNQMFYLEICLQSYLC